MVISSDQELIDRLILPYHFHQSHDCNCTPRKTLESDRLAVGHAGVYPKGTKAPALQIFEGICEGEIILEERGTGGFGYDPIFLLQGLGKTLADLSMDEKNRLSHWARAVIKAKEILNDLFANAG